MATDSERKFTDNNSISKEEFIAQFEDESTEIIVRVRYSWKKGDRPFPKFGKESLANIDYNMPWLADPERPWGPCGKIFWFCKKSLFGYPYKPEFKSDKIILYRLRVRPGRFCVRPGVVYYFLEEVLEENVDLIHDDTVYKNALAIYFSDTEEKACEMTVQMSADIDVSERTFLNPYSINRYIRPFNSVRFADSDKARMIEGQLEIPYDERDFSGNRNLKIKAGSSIRITARKRTAPGMEGFYVLDKLLDTDIRDDELTSLKVQALTPGKWHIDGIGDFDVDHGEATSLILWDPSDDNTEVYVTLICDSDNPKSAALATDHLMKILGDKKSFEAKVYGAMVNRQIEENGMIETWEEGDEGNVTLTKEEFIKRLSIRNLTLDPDGSGSVMVGLDGMFTDHAYSVFVNADGTCEPNGLIG